MSQRKIPAKQKQEKPIVQTKLSEVTVLSNLSISQWIGFRTDRKASDEVHRTNDASADAGNYNKRLLPKGSMDKINAVVNGARVYHRTNTLPWLDAGARILPASHYMEYAARMKDYRQQFEQETADFLKEYVSLQKQAKTRLGKLYNENDYPSMEKLAKSFSWELDILPFPDSTDFRVTGIENIEAIRSDLQERMNSVFTDAMKDVSERIVEVVGRMAERLKGYKPGKPGKRAENTFKDSLVSNVQELVELLPLFNLNSDPKLAKIIGKMKSELCKYTADDLREDEHVRAKVADSADAILTAVSDFIM